MFTKNCMLVSMILVALVAAFVPATASAALITGVTIAGYGSDSHSPGNDRRAIHVVDNSGMSDAGSPTFLGGTHGNQPNAPTWPESTYIGYMWQGNGTLESGNPSGGWIAFDLGASYTVDKIHVWNFNEGGTSLKTDAKSVNISYSTDGNTYTLAENRTFAQADASPTYAGEIITLNSNITGRYVKFDCLSTWGAWTQHQWDAVGLAEVRFNSAQEEPPIPEPATMALLGLGVAGLGGYLRRRRAA